MRFVLIRFCILGLSFFSLFAKADVMGDYLKEKGEEMMELAGYKAAGSKVHEGVVVVTNRIEISGKSYTLTKQSGGSFTWQQEVSNPNEEAEFGRGYCKYLATPQEAALKVFELIRLGTNAFTEEKLVSMMKIDRSWFSGVGRVSSSSYYAIQSGNFIVFVRKGPVAKAIAETLYTNNVLKVKK